MAFGGFAPGQILSPRSARDAVNGSASLQPVIRVYAVVAAGMVALILAFYAVGWRPLTAYLAETNDFRLATAVAWAVEAVDDHLDSHRVLAVQIGSRSAIRDAQAALLDGSMRRSDFVAFAEPKLRDALDPAAGVVAIHRFLPDGTELLAVGAPVLDGARTVAAPSPTDQTGLSDRVRLTAVTEGPTGIGRLIYRSVLFGRDGQVLGYDLIAISTDPLADLLAHAGERDIAHGVTIAAGSEPLLLSGRTGDAAGPEAQLIAAAIGWPLPDRYLVKEQSTLLGTLSVLSVIDADSFRAPLLEQQRRLLWVVFGGLVLFMVATVLALRPVIRRVEQARAAERSRQFYRQLFRGSNAAMLLIDPADGHVWRANDAAKELLGQTIDRGRGPIGLAPLPQEPLAPGSWQTQVTGAAAEPLEIEVHATLVTWEDRPVLFAILHDITERVRQANDLILARHEAEAASRAKSEFLAAMSHELRTPLNAILGFSEVIRDALLGPSTAPAEAERYRAYAGDIHRSGEHLLQLIDDILDLGRVESGRMPLTLDTVDPQRLVADGIRLIEDRAGAHGLRVETQLPCQPTRFLGDPRAARQILFNLLSNAVKFTPDGGTVCVSVRQDPERGTTISVTDTGIGIDATEKASLFQPFVRGTDAVRRAIQGTGLGLVLVRALIERHGGRVEVESRHGEGSRFSVTFPPAAIVRRHVERAD